MAIDRDLANFSRMVEALAPWLEQIVVIGGWAHRLYHYHALAQPLDHPPLTTLDADIALPDRLPKNPEADMRERLVKAGFDEEFLGKDNPPATHFRFGSDPTGFYAEFLTPLVGSGYKHGKRDATANIAGVNAQRLRYVDLLLQSPWSVKLDDRRGFPLTKPIQVRVANPAAYLAQKILAFERRPKEDQGKEILYMHDTIELFARSLPQIGSEWNDNTKAHVHERAVRLVERSAADMFDHTTDAIREAALIVRERGLSPESVRQVCQAGLQQIFH
ncbi:MAG TPA: GSU2403 family nucleotidyltransferase fold protein [Terriglobales bacterium]|nr:GSU2403 family nucleotidyltransferase fold protein [Terriglobales bacterium]